MGHVGNKFYNEGLHAKHGRTLEWSQGTRKICIVLLILVNI